MTEQDPLLKDILRSASNAGASVNANKKASAAHPAISLIKEWYRIGIFWTFLTRGSIWIYRKMIYPFSSRVIRFARRLFKWYREIFIWAISYKDQYGNDHKSVTRSAAMILATIFSIWAGYHIVQLAVTSVWYVATVEHDEEVYLYNSQKVSDGLNPYSSLDDVYEVTGCETYPCGDKDTLTFNVRNSLFNELWSIWHKHQLFYPNYVAGVAPVVQRCTITSYGYRKKFRAVVRQFDWYSDLLQVKGCLPIKADDPRLNNRTYR